jgi:hypothetical protein
MRWAGRNVLTREKRNTGATVFWWESQRKENTRRTYVDICVKKLFVWILKRMRWYGLDYSGLT